MVGPEFCQIFGDLTTDVNWKYMFLNFNFVYTVLFHKLRGLRYILYIDFIPIFLTIYILLQPVEQKQRN